MIDRDEKRKAELRALQNRIHADLDQLRQRHANLKKAENRIAFSLLAPEQEQAKS